MALPRPSVAEGDPLRIVVGGGGMLWAVNLAWLARLKPDGWRVVMDEPLIEGNSPLRGLASARGDGVWLGWGEELKKWSRGEWRETYRRPSGQVDGAINLLEDRQGGLWGGGYVSGLFRITADGRSQTGGRSVGLRNPSVLQLLEDTEGNIWVGTNSGGVLRWRPCAIGISSEESELAQLIVNSLIPYDGGFFLAIHGGGVRQWRDGRFSRPFWELGPSHSSWPQSLWADADGRCWPQSNTECPG
ncbi:MAG: hypothetical protein J6386_13620 [Candidatus Synoicihabitans palmerolidicus]|nr:hypothetical protein [Candidatus Synoicihabitans palmerolidicus]